MRPFSVRSVGSAAVLLLAVAVAAAFGATPLWAQDRRQNTPGQFDFYVLALSWSPSYCDAQGAQAPRTQCGERPYAFVVHGLWPQYESGFPEFCRVPAPRLDRNIVNAMLDLMPAPQLVYHQWDKHGTCTGASARAYFQSVRKARAAVKIPERYIDLGSFLTVSPGEVVQAFLAANPGLSRDAIVVNCDTRRLREVRICMTRDFAFRDCAGPAARSCSREKLIMPPVRGSRRSGGPADVPATQAAQAAAPAELNR